MKIIREFFQIVVTNKKILFSYILILPILTLGCCMILSKKLELYKVNYSRSDLVLHTFGSDTFIWIMIVFITLLFIMVLLRYDFMISVIIRQRSKVSLWFHQVSKAVVSSFFVATYMFIFLFLFSFLLSSVNNNWNMLDSAFADTMRFVLDAPVSFLSISVAEFLFLFSLLVTMSLLYLLFRWQFHSEIVGWLSVIIYLLYCSSESHFLNYISTCYIGYKHFVDLSNLLWPLLAPLLWIGVLLGAGALLANRAEFYSAGKK